MGYTGGVGADAVLDFRVEAGGGAEDCEEGVGVEEVEDAAGGDLVGMSVCADGDHESRQDLTSPPPMTRTRLFLTCQARMREPPGWTSGYCGSPMLGRCGVVAYILCLEFVEEVDEQHVER